MEKRFVVGSFYFFRDMPGYKLHDIDYVMISDEMLKDYHKLCVVENNMMKDIFYWKAHSAEWHVQYLLRDNAFALDIAKFLVPHVAEYVGFTIDHLKQVRHVLDKLNEQLGSDRYDYYKIICDAYIANGSFTLTDEQRMEAYQLYLSSRQ